ncbi:c-type cytochrome [Tropicimonas sp.]|uniref:c-type cytochrome n=1 Tax=Tropicimonas sp. TaxID=2067044 RepID=UPI003A84BB8B
MRHAIMPGVISLAAVLITAPVLAQDRPDPAIDARQSVMHLYAFNLGQLGAMAKQEIAYDADMATKAANNIVLLTQIDQSAFWPQGTDNAVDTNSRALPDVWANFDDLAAKGKALGDAALAMQTAAGTDLAALQGAMGPLGGACSACHKAYRAPDD